MTSVRRRLINKRNEFEHRLERLKKTARQGLSADSKEQAIELQNLEVRQALVEEAEEELAKAKESLRRLDNGKYGVCRDCGNQIAQERLMARPNAQRCMPCHEIHEPTGTKSQWRGK